MKKTILFLVAILCLVIISNGAITVKAQEVERNEIQELMNDAEHLIEGRSAILVGNSQVEQKNFFQI